MATYKHLRSSTANKRPTTSIADGQLAINSNAASAGLFFKDSTGATIIKVGPVHVGATAPNATPGAGGSSGNSTGEVWLDTSLTPVGVKIWNGSAWVNGTPTGSTTVQGLLELATDVETQAGSDAARAVTPAGLQSKVSDSTSTTSSTTIASSTAVKSAFDLANAALPKSGGTVTGNLEIGTAGSLTFEGSTADGFETTLAVVDPTDDRTIRLPNISGTVVTTGDTGTVTSTMLLDGTIVNADVNASAAIAGTKIAPDFGSQTVQTTGIVSHALGTALAPTVTFTGDTNTGIYSPGADQLALATGGTGRLFVDASGRFGIGQSAISSPLDDLHISSAEPGFILEETDAGTDEKRWRIRAEGSILRFEGINDAFNATTAWLNVTRTTGARTVDNIAFSTGTTERMRLDSSGGFQLKGAGTAGVTQAVSFNGSAPVNSLVITSGGLVGLGTSAPDSTLNVRAGANNTAAEDIASFSRPDAAVRAAITKGLIGGTTNGIAFGTTTNHPFALNTNGSERIYITSAGNVGLGSSNPLYTFDCRGQGAFELYNTSGGGNVLNFRPSLGDANKYNMSISSYDHSGNGTSNADGLSINGFDGVSICTDNSTGRTERLRVTQAGLVGIGTMSPATLLHLSSATGSAAPSPTELRIATTTVASDWSATNPWGRISFYNEDGSGSGPKIHAAIDATALTTVGGTSDLVFSTNNNLSNTLEARMVIKGDSASAGARVGIGVTAPGGALDIKAAATIHPVIVQGPLSEFARIDSSGRLLVGTSSSLSAGNWSDSLIQVRGNSSGSTFEAKLALFTGRTIAAGIGAGESLGRVAFGNGEGGEAAWITAQADAGWSASDYPGRIVFSTTPDGTATPVERFRITNDGVIAHDQPAPAAVNATATLTIANLKAGIITSTSAAATDMTLPTGTDTQAGFSSTYDNFTFEWSVINTGPSLVRVLAGTAHTVVGSGSVATGTSGRFASRRTAANTFVTYRLS
jgi:hypothetical protein